MALLSKEEYGKFFLINTLSAMFAPVLLSTAHNIIIYESEKLRLVTILLVRLWIMNAAFWFLMFQFVPIFLDLPYYLGVLGFVFSLCQSNNKLMENIFRKSKNVYKYLCYNIIPSCISGLGGLLLIYFFNYGFETRYICYIVISLTLILTFLLPLLIRQGNNTIPITSSMRIKKSYFSGIPYILLLGLFSNIDRIAIKKFYSIDVFNNVAPQYLIVSLCLGLLTIVDRTYLVNLWMKEGLSFKFFFNSSAKIFTISGCGTLFITFSVMNLSISKIFDPMFTSLLVIDTFVCSFLGNILMYCQKVGKHMFSICVLCAFCLIYYYSIFFFIPKLEVLLLLKTCLSMGAIQVVFKLLNNE